MHSQIPKPWKGVAGVVERTNSCKLGRKVENHVKCSTGMAMDRKISKEGA